MIVLRGSHVRSQIRAGITRGPPAAGGLVEQTRIDNESILRYKNNLVSNDVFGLRSFLPLRHFHRDFLSFLKGFEAFHLDRGMMNENVLPTFTLDETKALVIIEPLDGSCNSFA